MSEFIKRVLVAIIGIPLAIIVIYTGGWLLFALTAILSSLAQWEFYKISEKKHAFPGMITGIVTGILLLLNFTYYPVLVAFIYAIAIIMLFVIFVLLVELWAKKPNAGINISSTITGVVYLPLSFSFLLLIRNLYQSLDGIQSATIDFITVKTPLILANDTEGAWLLLSIFIAIWVCDSAAYFTGKALGKHKLFERISPKKTWEGAVGGFVFGVLAFWGATEILLTQFPLVHVIVIGIIVGTIGQIGDLAESQLKRDAGVKDSSAIIPGHGGILDRFDSILFVIPVVYIYLFFSSVSF